MTQDLKLRRKWTFRAHGKQMVFTKKTLESDIHVLMKAFLWALFLPDYPDLSVEIQIGDRFKPDLVQLGDGGIPVFWGEAGRVSLRKTKALVHRFRYTHLVFAKWNMNLVPFRQILKKETGSDRRLAPIDLISFPAESGERFIHRDGTIQINFRDVNRVRC
jgi:hypothetical protein